MKSRLLLVAAAALPLSACNMVISEKPWFTEASGPQFKDGLWANFKSADCVLDPAAEIDTWPECASPILIKGGSYSGPPSGRSASPEARSDPAKWDKIEHVLVDGTPQIDQMMLVIKEGEGIRPKDGRKEQPIFIYLAVRAVAKDDRGQIIETQRWPVMCGPPPAKPTGKDPASAFNSDKPFKGITVQDGACVAGSIEALRGAAAASEAFVGTAGTSKLTSRWIRASVD